jgi:hypothetical protein
MPILLEDDQFVGRLNYYKMSAPPDRVYGGSIGSSYQQQGLALSKQFKRDHEYLSGSANNSAAEERPAGRPPSQKRLDTPDMEDDDDPIAGVTFADNSAARLINARNR